MYLYWFNQLLCGDIEQMYDASEEVSLDSQYAALI